MAIDRLQPPAYGRGLVNVRRAGFHPLIVNVLYAADWAPAKAYQDAAGALRERRIDPFCHRWRARAGWPWVVVSPREYQPGRIDWRVLVGVMACLHDPEGRALSAARGTTGPFFALVAEIARLAAVFVKSPALGEEMSAGTLAYQWSEFRGWRRAAWPAWWSDDLDREHDGFIDRWQRDAEAYYQLAA